MKLKRYNPEADWDITISNFKNYVIESGLPWPKYKRFIPKRFQNLQLVPLPPSEFEGEPNAAALQKCLLENAAKILSDP